MPAVKGKSKAKRKSPAKKKGRGRRKAPMTFRERLGEGLSRIGHFVVTYTVVGLTVAAFLVVMMLFAGGYFWNIGERIDSLTSRAAKVMGFSVSRVTLRGGEHLTDREVLDALWDNEAGSILGQSLLHVDASETRADIEAIGWVHVAAVQKLWPNTLQITVAERRPHALWLDDRGQYFLIDSEGVVLAQVAPTDYTDLPVVTGTDDRRGPRPRLFNPFYSAPIFTPEPLRLRVLRGVALTSGFGMISRPNYLKLTSSLPLIG